MENNFFQQNNDIFQNDELNYNKNNTIQHEFNRLDFSSIETVYTLLDEYFSMKDDSSLQLAKNKLNSEKLNIKGSLDKYNINIQSYDSINDNILINNGNNILYEFEIVLRKINVKNNNLLSSYDSNGYNYNYEENNSIIKYHIKLSNIARDHKIALKKTFDKYYKPILAITNLEAYLELNEIKKYIIKFKDTSDTKIFLEINKIFEQLNLKKNFRRSSGGTGQIQMINVYLKNNFNEIKNISYQFLKENRIKKYCNSAGCFYDIKNFLEIGTESLYVENLKNEFFSGYLLKTYNIDICCLAKKISNIDTF
jgi:hypothetical protein